MPRGLDPNGEDFRDRGERRTVSLASIAASWLRIGCVGFGGPPAHIALLRQLCVTRRGWLSAADFEDAISATNLLPGPASTQLAIYCAWRLRRTAGALVGGVCFILPGLVLILAFSALLLSGHPSPPILGAAAGAAAAVPVVAVHAAGGLLPSSWQRAGTGRAGRYRFVGYLVAGILAAVFLGAWLVVVLLGCGLVEVLVRGGRSLAPRTRAGLAVLAGSPLLSGFAAITWVAFKVGALSYGGGFVIIPLMQADAVHRYHWMTSSQFLYAVALGQITPGPVVQTVAVVGYAAAGVTGGLVAAVVAFAPSFLFVLAGGRYFEALRVDPRVRAFLTGSGPAAIGAIAGSAIVLATGLSHLWQVAVLVLAAIWLLALRRGVVSTLLAAAALGLGAVAVAHVALG